MKKRLLLLCIATLSTILSNAQQKSFTLKGMIGGIQEENVRLYMNTGESYEFIDSVKTTNGEFEFTGNCTQAFAAQIRISKFRRCKIWISPGKMNLLIHEKEMKNRFLIGKLTGSPAQNRYEDYQRKLNENNQQKLKIADELELKVVQTDSTQKALFKAKYKELNRFKNEYFYQYASSPVVPFLIYQDFFAAKHDLDYLKAKISYLKKANPNGMYVKNLAYRIKLMDQLNAHGPFPKLKAKTLTNQVYDVSQQKGKPILIFIWRAWRPDFNEKYYNAIQEITQLFPSLELVSIIRTSSFIRIRIPGTNKTKLWRPEPRPELNCVEIESLDKNVPLVRYIDNNFHAFILNKKGEILYHQNKFDQELLKSQLSLYLSNMN